MAISKITGSALDKDVIMKDVATADGSSPTLTLQTGDTNIEADDVLGTINFQAPDEGTGTDAILVAAGISAISEGDFSSSSNATSLKFVTGNSAAAGSDGGSMILSSTGNLTLKDLRTADGSSPTITLQSGDTNMEADDVLGTINFQAPDEGAGTDAILVAAGISAISEGDFSSSNNATKLSFKTGASETATEKMSIASSGSTTITTTGNENTLILKSTDADANIGPVLELNRASSSPGVNDQLGRIDIVGKNDADEDIDYVRYISQIRDETDGTEDGRMAINTVVNGAMISRLNIEPTETVFNDESNSVDFRVESNGDANCLFVDASADRVGIGSNAPAALLDVDGTAKSKDLLVANSDKVVSGFSNCLLTIDGTGGSDTGDAGVLMKTPTNTRGFFMDKSDDNTFRIFGGNGAGHSSDFKISNVGNVVIGGSLSKGSGSFKIRHPLESKKNTHWLVHSFVEGPQADNIYRGKVALVDGTATQNIDTVAGMTEGTFDALNREVQCFTTNETGWTAIKGSVSGNVLTITAQENTCTDTISWMVIGERKDEHMMSKHTKWTDSDGKIIIEPELTDREKEDKTDYVEGTGE